jgi:outer membrane autotransporter protein
MSGTTERIETDLENGFDSDTSGAVIGLDYLFGDAFILGVAVGSTSDEGDVKGGGGAFETDSLSTTLYATWMLNDYLSLDAYLGNGDSDIDNRRNAVLGDINETPRGSAEGTQELSGISANFDVSIGAWSVGAFIARDQSETKIDPYTETGGSLLVLSYPEQTIESETETIGLRSGYAFSAGWGTFIPSIQYSMVDENKNDKRFIDANLPFTPDYFFTVETDAPDREYELQTLQLLAAFNGGNQLFLSHEKRSGHEFLEDSFITAGAIFSF